MLEVSDSIEDVRANGLHVQVGFQRMTMTRNVRFLHAKVVQSDVRSPYLICLLALDALFLTYPPVDDEGAQRHSTHSLEFPDCQ